MTAAVARRQWGGATLIVIVSALALSTMAIGAATVGRLAVHRLDVQRAADAAVLSALEVVRHRGLPLDSEGERAAADVGNGNSRLPVQFAWRLRESERALLLEVTAHARAPVPGLLGGGETEITAVARAALPQLRFDRIDRPRAAMVLVLDYSTSMKLPFAGGQRRAVDVLENAVGRVLDASLDLDIAAVFFADTVLRTVPSGSGSRQEIRLAMDGLDAKGLTATAEGLAAAMPLLNGASRFGRYVVLISDGDPCCAADSVPRAHLAAGALWDQGVTILTLEIQREQSSARLSDFMTSIAGSRERTGDPSLHAVARSGEELNAALEKFSRSIACVAGPLPAGVAPEALRVFLDEGGGEHAVLASADLDGHDLRYAFDPASRVLRLNRAACAAVDRGATIVVRPGRPALAP